MAQQNSTQTDYDRFSRLEDPNDQYQALEDLPMPRKTEHMSIGSHFFQLLLACTSYLLIVELSHFVRLPNFAVNMPNGTPILFPDWVGTLFLTFAGFLGAILGAISFALSAILNFFFTSVPGVVANGFLYVIMAVSALVHVLPLPSFLSAFSITLILIALTGKLLSLPLEIVTARGMQAQVALRPALERLQQQYGADREKLAQKQMELYSMAGVNPLAGCLPVIPQLLLFSGLWVAVQNMIMLNLQVDTAFLWIPALATCEPSRWCDANRSGMIYPIPVLILVFIIVNWDSKRIRSANPGTDPYPNASRHVKNVITIGVALTLTTMPSAIVLYVVLQRWLGTLSERALFSRSLVSPKVAKLAGR